MEQRTYNDRITRDIYAHWLRHSVSLFDDKSWHALTLRADTSLENASRAPQDLFSDNSTHSRDLVEKALSWAITEQQRREKSDDFAFVAFHGGDRAIGIRPHIHAICRSVSPDTIENIARLWHSRLARAFRLSLSDTTTNITDRDHNCQKIVRSSVLITTRPNNKFRSSVFTEPLRDAGNFIDYCQRVEGDQRDGHFGKLIINRSLILPTTFSVLPKSHG
jgi:hypothetical protein